MTYFNPQTHVGIRTYAIRSGSRRNLKTQRVIAMNQAEMLQAFGNHADFRDEHD